MFNAALPLAAKAYAFGEALQQGGSITFSLEDVAHDNESPIWYFGEVLAHELGHSMGLEDAYQYNPPALPYTQLPPNDIMSTVSTQGLGFGAENITALQYSAGSEPDDIGAPLKAALHVYETNWNGSTQPTHAAVDIPPIGITTSPVLAVTAPGQGFNSGDQLDMGTVLADGPGGQSASVILTLQNRGGLPLTINSVQFAAGNQDFSIAGTNPAGQTLAPGASVPLNVRFDPRAPGASSNTLTITSNAASSTFLLKLTGNGLTTTGQVAVTVAPAAFTGLPNNNFGGARIGGAAVTRHNYATVTNTGGGPLTITQIQVGVGANEYSLSALPAGFDATHPIILAPGQSFGFDLTFTAAAIGLQPGTINIVSDDPKNRTTVLSVTGTGLPQSGTALHWGNDFVMLETGTTSPIRFRSDVNGNFHFNLLPNTPYELQVFDPDSGLVWHTEAVSSAAGKFTDLGKPFFAASTAPASHGDGVPDDIADIMGPGRFFDFGTADSPVAPGYTQVVPTTAYSAAAGFGWLLGPGETVTAADQSGTTRVASALKRDFNATSAGTFAVDVPNGTYDVTVTLGDAAQAHNAMVVFVQGERRGNISTLAGEFVTNTYRAAVSDGQLQVRFEGEGGAQVVVDGIEVAQVSSAVPTAPLADSTGLHYFAIQDLKTGFIMRGSINLITGGALCPAGVFLSANTPYREFVLQASTLQVGVSDFTTPASGITFTMPEILLGPDTSPDSDGDGLHDLGEFIVGTNANKADTNADGITDLAALQQGLNPLAGLAFPTGVIASLPLQGQAQSVALVGSVSSQTGQTAYVATGSYGLAIVNASQFNQPIVQGQIAVPGNSTNVAVNTTDNLAIVASGPGGVNIVDVTDPTRPVLDQTVKLPGGAQAVVFFDGLAYVASGPSLVSIDPLTGEVGQTLKLGGGQITGLAREGSFLYSMDDRNTLRIVDVSGFVMVARGSLTTPDGGGQLFVNNGVAYIAAANYFRGGFDTADVSNPDKPALLSGANTSQTSVLAATAIVPNGSGLGILIGTPQRSTTGPVVNLMDLSDPTNTMAYLTQFSIPGTPMSATIASGIAFIADGPGGSRSSTTSPSITRACPRRSRSPAPWPTPIPTPPASRWSRGATCRSRSSPATTCRCATSSCWSTARSWPTTSRYLIISTWSCPPSPRQARR